MKKPDKINGGKTDKILVFGRGQVAGFVEEYFSEVVVSKADVRKPIEIEHEVKKVKPDAVINTAAKTSIDWCELNKVEAFAVNTLGAMNVWKQCRKQGIFMCQFSSGCIFSSRTVDEVWEEDDPPNPQCYYSWTKVWAENLLGRWPNLLIIRPRVMISSRVDRRNTLAKWLTYSRFISDQNSVTVVEGLMPVLKRLIKRRISGTFNIVNRGTISPLEVARMLKKQVNPEMTIEETTLEEVNRNLFAKRCTVSLKAEKLATVGYQLPPVWESVEKVIGKFKNNLEAAGGLPALEEVRKETREKFELGGAGGAAFCAS
jgi:dTDP-4-dehydrorhamnose reductase